MNHIVPILSFLHVLSQSVSRQACALPSSFRPPKAFSRAIAFAPNLSIPSTGALVLPCGNLALFHRYFHKTVLNRLKHNKSMTIQPCFHHQNHPLTPKSIPKGAHHNADSFGIGTLHAQCIPGGHIVIHTPSDLPPEQKHFLSQCIPGGHTVIHAPSASPPKQKHLRIPMYSQTAQSIARQTRRHHKKPAFGQTSRGNLNLHPPENHSRQIFNLRFSCLLPQCSTYTYLFPLY